MSPATESKLPSNAALEAPYPKPVRAWYVLGLLTLVYIFSFLDRTILTLLVGPIRRDLHITDTQVSLLIGLSFAVFYTFLGVPIGRLADSRSRRGVIAAGISIWSLFCAGCGLAKRFGQMLVLRMGVGVGEASLSPAAYSLLTDYFVPERRAMAMSIYNTGIYIGTGAASILGGLVTGWAAARGAWTLPLVGDVRSWQVVFFVVGLPGLLLAILMYTFGACSSRPHSRDEPSAPRSVLIRQEPSPNLPLSSPRHRILGSGGLWRPGMESDFLHAASPLDCCASRQRHRHWRSRRRLSGLAIGRVARGPARRARC